VLPARAARTERLPDQVVGPDLDLDAPLDLRQHVHRGERRLPAGVGVEGADPHQPMHPRLALEVPIGVVADHLQRRTPDPGFLVLQLVHQFDLEAVALGPARVQAQEHLRPVACFRAAGARLDADVGIAGVLRPAQHRLQLEGVDLAFELPQLDLEVRLEGRIFLAQFGEGLQVLDPAFEFLVGLEEAVQGLELVDGVLGLFLVVPEARLAHPGVELVAFFLFAGDVKDCLGSG
jgi:hypothetical protein